MDKKRSWRWLLVSLVFGIGLLISVIQKLVLYNTSTLYYRELNQVRLNPLDLDSAQLLADSNGKTQQLYQVDTLPINQRSYAMLNQQLAALFTKVVP